MNQFFRLLNANSIVSGAFYMIAAGVAFAIANVITRHVTYGLGMSSTSESFWQYGFALLFSLPVLARLGLGAMRTSRPGAHLIRVVLSVLGVQAFVYGFAHGVSFGQVMALVMTSPFFITIGAALFFGETIRPQRWIAIAIGFAGALIILQPWNDGFTIFALAPVAAAILWGASSLVTKSLLKDEPSSTVTIWLLLLIAPSNFAFAVSTGFQWPAGIMWGFLIVSGLVMAISQYCLVKAYEVAPANYLQPFDDLKLPVNFALGWLFLGEGISGSLWIGAIFIMAASFYNVMSEQRLQKAEAAA